MVDDMQDNGYEASTVHHAVSALGKCINYSVDEGWAKRNPLKEGERLRMPTLPKVETFTEEEYQALVDAANRQAPSENLLTYLNRRAVVYLGGEGGLRPGESFGLQWENILFEQGRIHVKHSHGRFGLKGTKTGRERYVTLTEGIYEALDDL